MPTGDMHTQIMPSLDFSATIWAGFRLVKMNVFNMSVSIRVVIKNDGASIIGAREFLNAI